MQIAIILLIFCNCNLVFGYDRGDPSYFLSLNAKDSTFKSLTVHDDVTFEGETSVSEAVVNGKTAVDGPSFFGTLETLDAAVSSVGVENDFETGSLTVSESVHGLENIDIIGNINSSHLNTTSIVAESANIRSLETVSLDVEKNLVSGTVDITNEVAANSIQTNLLDSEFAEVEGDVVASDVSFASAQASYLSTTELTTTSVEVLSFAATTKDLTSDSITTGPAVVTRNITSVNTTALGKAEINDGIFASGDISVDGFSKINKSASASSANLTSFASNSLHISTNATFFSLGITQDAESGSFKTGDLEADDIYIEETATANISSADNVYGEILNASLAGVNEMDVAEDSEATVFGSLQGKAQSIIVKGDVGKLLPVQISSNKTMTAGNVDITGTLGSATVESITLETTQVSSTNFYTGSCFVEFFEGEAAYVEQFIDARTFSTPKLFSGDKEAQFEITNVAGSSEIENVETNKLSAQEVVTETFEAEEVNAVAAIALSADLDSFTTGQLYDVVTLVSLQKADFGSLNYEGDPHTTSSISYCYLSDYATAITSTYCHQLVLSMALDAQLKVHHSPSGYVHTYVEDKQNPGAKAFLITCERWPCHDSYFWWETVPYYDNVEMKIFDSILHIYGVRMNEEDNSTSDFAVTWCNSSQCNNGITSRTFITNVTQDSKLFSDIFANGDLYFVYDDVVGKIEHYKFFNTSSTVITLDSNTLVHPVVLPMIVAGLPHEIVVASPVANGVGYSLSFRACQFGTPSCVSFGANLENPFSDQYYIPVPSVRSFTGVKADGYFVFGYTPKWTSDSSFYGQASAAYAIVFGEGDFVSISYWGSQVKELMSSTDATNDIVIGDNFVGIQAFSENYRVTFALTHIHGYIENFDDLNITSPVVYLPPIIVQCQTSTCSNVFFVTSSPRFTSHFTPTAPYSFSFYSNQVVIAGMPFLDVNFFDFAFYAPSLNRISPVFQRIDFTKERMFCNQETRGRILKRNGVLGVCTYYNTEDIISGVSFMVSERQTFTPFGKWIVHAKSVFAQNMMNNFLEISNGKRSQPLENPPINFMEVAERLEEAEKRFNERNIVGKTNRKMASQIL